MRPHQLLYRTKDDPQRGAALVFDLIIYIVMLSLLGISVASGVKMLVTQQAAGANVLQQKSSVLQAMNRTSADIAASKPIIYAGPTELITENVLNVAGQTPKTVQQRYVLGRAPGAASTAPLDTLYSQQRTVTAGQKYDPAQAATVWGTPNATQVIVRNIKTPVTNIYKYYDRSGNLLPATGVLVNSQTDVIARVDSVLTANLEKSGYVQLASSAVPRSALPVDVDVANLAPPTCPPASAYRSDDGANTIVRWSQVDGSNTYEVWRDGVKVNATSAVIGQDDYFFQEPLIQDGKPHQYVVLSVSASGVSSGCNPVNVTSIMPATILTGEMIPPTSGSNPWSSTAWNDPSQETVMRLKWNSVVGATRYTLYRQPVADNGTLGTKVETATFLPGDVLTYDYPAEWDKKWSWFVSVNNSSGGSKDSNAIALRGYPSPVTPSMTAPTYSTNTVDWTAYAPDANVSAYYVYRSKDGAPNGGYDLLATFNRGTANFTAEKYIDNGTTHAFGKPELGSTHTYVVIARNESGYSNKITDSQLQFPPDPGLVPVSATGSRDNDNGGVRSNTLKWTQPKSATSYEVIRSVAANGTVTNYCITSTDCYDPAGAQTALSKTDTDTAFVTPSSVQQYTALAYNATGRSPGLAGTLPIYQRPPAQAIVTPDGTNEPSLTSTDTTISFSRNAGAFCQTGTVTPGSDKCSYEVSNYKNDGTILGTGSVDATVEKVTFQNQDWGRHYTYKQRSRNGAVTNNGWSDYSNTVAADTYPGDFDVAAGKGSADLISASDKKYTDQYWDFVYKTVDSGTQYFPGCNGDYSRDCGPKWGEIVTTWGTSTGAKSMQVIRTHVDATPTSTTITTPASGAAGKADATAWPGVTYRWTVKATSLENSLTRTVNSANINTNPDVNNASEIMLTCIGSGSSEYFKIQQTRFNYWPVRGNWSTGTTYSIVQYGKDQTIYGGNVNASYAQGSTYNALNATTAGVKGNAYAMSGFRNYVTWNGVGYSLINENSLTQVAPPMGCGAVTGPNADQGNYIEPWNACYGYKVGMTTQECSPTIPGNRPQYYSK